MISVKELMDSAKGCLTAGNKEGAKLHLNQGIGVLGMYTINGVERVDGATVDRWKERFWFQLESNDLLEA